MQRFFTLFFFFLFYILHIDYRNGKFEGRGGEKKEILESSLSSIDSICTRTRWSEQDGIEETVEQPLLHLLPWPLS